MKHIAIAFWSLLLSMPAIAQITLEQEYVGAKLSLFMVNLEYSGMKYVSKSEVPGNRFLKFYNLDHSLWKTIDCDSLPVINDGYFGNVYSYSALYISESVFDCDSSVEFLYCMQSAYRWFTGIYKEDGTPLLIADSCAPLVVTNVPQQFRPMYNTPGGTKLILSKENGNAYVYNVPCTLSTGIDQLSQRPVDDGMLRTYPNPAFYETNVEYSLPKGSTNGEVLITDLNGREMKRYKVDGTFHNLLISKGELPAGTYLYSLVCNGSLITAQKAIRFD